LRLEKVILSSALIGKIDKCNYLSSLNDLGAMMTNRLAHETSPYLLQHAHNPVDGYPWEEEALEKNRSENKPIILSIGYAVCHWCQSCESDYIAQLLNRCFISIKVDRKERPDLDNIT